MYPEIKEIQYEASIQKNITWDIRMQVSYNLVISVNPKYSISSLKDMLHSMIKCNTKMGV
jgi:hypothetical protein